MKKSYGQIRSTTKDDSHISQYYVNVVSPCEAQSVNFITDKRSGLCEEKKKKNMDKQSEPIGEHTIDRLIESGKINIVNHENDLNLLPPVMCLSFSASLKIR